MFKDKKLDIVINITDKILGIISSRHIALSRTRLFSYSSSLKAEEKEVYDLIISYAMQYKGKQPVARYNLVTPEDKHLELLDSLLVNFNKDSYTRLPHILQKTFYLCSSILLYRASPTVLRKSLSNYYVLAQPDTKDYTENFCKRCYVLTEDIICSSCAEKIHKCVEFINKSFSTTGTTIEGFEYSFKDWHVKVTSYGEYKLTKLDNESKEQYQPNLPFKEFQNFSGLIG